MRYYFFLFFSLLGYLLFAQELEAQWFGEAIDIEGEEILTIDDVLSDIDIYEDEVVIIKGRVTSVCQIKGCWMTLEHHDNDDIQVTFKDYGFFMPKDIAGREVLLGGVIYRTVTSVEELKHYAADAGKSSSEIEQITEPKEEIKILASGVKLL